MTMTSGAPGVQTNVISGGSMPIRGVGTSVAAFVGFTKTYVPKEGDPSDPSGVKPQLVTSWLQYKRVYGGMAPGLMLPYAVDGFFKNGGSVAYIVRAVSAGQGQPPRLQLPAATDPAVPSLTFHALESTSARLEVEISGPPPPAEGEEPSDGYTIRLFADGQESEVIPDVSFGKSPRTVLKTINDKATAFRVEISNQQGTSLLDRAPSPGRYALTEPPPEPADPGVLQGSEDERTGYEGLAIAEDVTMVAVPDLVTATTKPDGSFDERAYLSFQKDLIDYCTLTKRMAILDPPPGLRATQALEWRTKLERDSSYATCYYPNVVVKNETSAEEVGADRYITVPPSGHIAGVWSRTDASKGVWKAPANEALSGVDSLETFVTEGEQSQLNPKGINCIRSFTEGGVRVYGARTISLVDTTWSYLNVRRVFNYVERSLKKGCEWVVFEPNSTSTRANVARNISAFLRGLWMAGGLAGNTPEQAFYVLCDETNNPKNTVREGKLFVEVGIAPLYPAEFVLITIKPWEGITGE